jgi:hypothetical protein
MKRIFATNLKTLVLLIVAGLAVPRFLTADISFLKGKVYDLGDGKSSLEQRFGAAEKESRAAEKSTAYLTAYSFMSRHRTNSHRQEKSPVPYKIRVERDHINLYRTWRGDAGRTIEFGAGPFPAVVLFLHRIQNGKSEIINLQIIDPEDVYEVPDVPVYWLGDAGNEESLSFLKKSFDSAPLSFQKSLVFAVSCHDQPQALEFLRKVGAGDFELELRKTAVLFSVGYGRDDGAVGFLKDLYAKEKSREMKKHIIFVLSTDKTEGSARELVRLAKTEADSSLRKDAIFWLGQKASEEAVRALKDVVDGDKNSEVKKQAVFAISQLPRDKSVPMLIDIAKTNDSPSVRKNAIFWLGQTGDERAVSFLEDILLGKKR